MMGKVEEIHLHSGFRKERKLIIKKNYPAFYDLVKNILPNVIKDANFLKALIDVTGIK
jgi:hypothetical protein